jgi:hypothetical protein
MPGGDFSRIGSAIMKSASDIDAAAVAGMAGGFHVPGL